MIPTGYSSPEYQKVYSKFGSTMGGLIYRDIPGSTFKDKVSVYPFLPKDLYGMYLTGDNIITSTIITNPLYPQLNLGGETYKEHAVVDLQTWDEKNLPENHKRNIKKCSGKMDVEVVLNPGYSAAELYTLYQNLIRKHNITQDAYTHYDLIQIKQLLSVPGTVLFRCITDMELLARTVNYTLFYIDSDDVYYHIGCQSNEGYSLNSNFLMMYEAIRFFKRLGLRYMEIGASPDGSSGDGLKRFKMGFSNMTKTNQIFKIIHNEKVYNELSKGHDTDKFPAYRFD